MSMRCRSCLTKSQKEYFPLLTVFPEFGGKSILDLINFVSSSQITYLESLPCEICLNCFKQLKSAYSFIILFNNSQAFLQKNSQKFSEKEKVYNSKVKGSANINPKKGSVEVLDSNSTERIVIVNDDENICEDMIQEIFGAEETINNKGSTQSWIKGTKNIKSSNVDSSTHEIILLSVDNILQKRLPSKKDYPRKSQEIAEISVMDHDEVIFKEDEVTFNGEDEVFFDDEGNEISCIVDEYFDGLCKTGNDEDNSDQDQKHQIRSSGDSEDDDNVMQEILKMEKNREKNINNIQIVTIEDVLNSTKKKNKRVLSVEDVINMKPRKKRSIDLEIFKCDICGSTFERRRNLTLHKFRIHNPDWREKFKCKICGLQCKTASAYIHHQLKHTKTRHICDQCGKTYLTKSKLKEHVLIVHEKKMDSRYLCTKCGKGFKFKNALGYHMNKHTNSRNFVCRYCGFASFALCAIKRHERTHTGERPYTCKFCKKTFAGAAEKQKHEFGHEGVFPFSCKYCDKKFIQIYNMKVHWLQHNGPYFCEICMRSFRDPEILKFHYGHSHKIKDVVIEDAKEQNDKLV